MRVTNQLDAAYEERRRRKPREGGERSNGTTTEHEIITVHRQTESFDKRQMGKLFKGEKRNDAGLDHAASSKSSVQRSAAIRRQESADSCGDDDHLEANAKAAGTSEEDSRFDNAVKTKLPAESFEEKLRQKLKKNKLKKKSKKKKKRASISHAANNATGLHATERMLLESEFERKKKARDDAKSKGSATKPRLLLTKEVSLRTDEHEIQETNHPPKFFDRARKARPSSPAPRCKSLVYLGRALFRRRVTPLIEADCRAAAALALADSLSSRWACFNCTYLNGLAGLTRDADACAVCREPRNARRRPHEQDQPVATVPIASENAKVLMQDSAQRILHPHDNESDSHGDLGNVLWLAAQRSLNDGFVGWGDLENDLEQAKRESLDENRGNLGDAVEQVKRESLDESWSNLRDVVEQVKRESLDESWGDLRDVLQQAKGESLDESWGDLGDVLEQAKRESLNESWGNLRGALEQAKQDSVFSLLRYDGNLSQDTTDRSKVAVCSPK